MNGALRRPSRSRYLDKIFARCKVRFLRRKKIIKIDVNAPFSIQTGFATISMRSSTYKV
jgi:hypothetical protein